MSRIVRVEVVTDYTPHIREMLLCPFLEKLYCFSIVSFVGRYASLVSIFVQIIFIDYCSCLSGHKVPFCYGSYHHRDKNHSYAGM